MGSCDTMMRGNFRNCSKQGTGGWVRMAWTEISRGGCGRVGLGGGHDGKDGRFGSR